MKNEMKTNTKNNAKTNANKTNELLKKAMATEVRHVKSAGEQKPAEQKPIEIKKPAEIKKPIDEKKPVEQKTTEKPAETKTEYKPAKRESASSKLMKLFQIAIDNKKITKEIEEKLTDKEYSKEQFKLSYPLLKKIIDGKDIKEQRKVNNYYRYQAKTIKINEHEYLVCNNIYDKQVNAMKAWVQKF